MNKSIYFDEDLFDDLKKISNEMKRSISFIVNEAVRKYLEEEGYYERKEDRIKK